jgi:hypothetical protein
MGTRYVVLVERRGERIPIITLRSRAAAYAIASRCDGYVFETVSED